MIASAAAAAAISCSDPIGPIMSLISAFFFLGALHDFHEVHEQARSMPRGWADMPHETQVFRNLTDGVVLPLWGAVLVIAMFVAPFLSMRLFAEERRNKTFDLLMTALAWLPLSRALIACNGGRDSALARALGGRWGDWKSIASPLIYLAAIVLAFFAPTMSCVLYAVVAALWFIPDRRIEGKVSSP